MRISNNGLYACVKQNVVSVLVALGGKVYIGYNGCDAYVEECPRKDMPSGMDYDLCRNVCSQRFHSEHSVCIQAGDDAKGSTIYLFNHTYCCNNCIIWMYDYRVKQVIFPMLNNKCISVEEMYNNIKDKE
jgi:deoxycytidylate deaminase